ncbi:hypothetical protein [Streptomyces sp. SAJ15]|uniref:hypothetical protein n=1 Tax=Streptomyces sp. SAJ15 TaxID=2011095 RepID=UPI001185B429|nr:hypothetical protein [Streptomyces sp. SAJ15]TVL93316.1 hypothetical protein CD790_09460 [Streptomyces sp. SAJ15]
MKKRFALAALAGAACTLGAPGAAAAPVPEGRISYSGEHATPYTPAQGEGPRIGPRPGGAPRWLGQVNRLNEAGQVVRDMDSALGIVAPVNDALPLN